MLIVGKFALEKCELFRAPRISKKSSLIDKCIYIHCYNLINSKTLLGILINVQHWSSHNKPNPWDKVVQI
jgi:hypothetical protein